MKNHIRAACACGRVDRVTPELCAASDMKDHSALIGRHTHLNTQLTLDSLFKRVAVLFYSHPLGSRHAAQTVKMYILMANNILKVEPVAVVQTVLIALL